MQLMIITRAFSENHPSVMRGSSVTVEMKALIGFEHKDEITGRRLEKRMMDAEMIGI